MEFVKEEMIEDLIGSFGEVLDVDIIMMVAEQLDYNGKYRIFFELNIQLLIHL